MPGGESQARKRADRKAWQGFHAHHALNQTYGAHIAAAASQLIHPDLAPTLIRLLPDGHAGTPDRQGLKVLIRAKLAEHVRHGVLRPALIDTYKAGWASGEHAAADAISRLRPLAKADRSSRATELSSAGPVVNWDSWTPGNIPAAAQAGNLDQLISDAVGENDAWATRAAMRGNLLASIEDTRLSVLADKLAAALEQGSTVDELTKVLNGVLTDTSWSEMVATTEMARAMTAASQASYQAAGIPARSVMTAEDQVVCQFCAENEDAGAIPFGSDFPNGPPPTHPSCRCAVVPDWIDTPVTPADVLGDGDPSDE